MYAHIFFTNLVEFRDSFLLQSRSPKKIEEMLVKELYEQYNHENGFNSRIEQYPEISIENCPIFKKQYLILGRN